MRSLPPLPSRTMSWCRSTGTSLTRSRRIYRFWEHLIRDEADFNRHIDCAHWNPVKDRAQVGHCPYSSFHRYVKPLTETAAHLVDHVFPQVPVGHRVLSLL
jgi:hypothetical protein